MTFLAAALIVSLVITVKVNADCEVGNGKVFADGQTFSFDRQHCVTYICKGNQYRVKKAECFDIDQNKCVPQGTLVKRKGCKFYECVEKETRFGTHIYFVQKQAQCIWEGNCYPDGDTITVNNKKCKCKADDVAYDIICPTEAENEAKLAGEQKKAEKKAKKD